MTVWGIEISEESVACAIENQELNAIGNTAFFAGNVGEVLADLRTRAGDPDVVVVDPPRAGLAGKALKRLGEIGAPRIVYVSCNPTTLAGDLKRLSRRLRLPARARAAGRHVPAHAARRVRRAPGAVTTYLCKACGTQYPPSDEPPARVPDLRGPAAVHPARRGPGLADVGGAPGEPRGGHSRRPRNPRLRLHAGVRDRPARAAREEHRRQRALGLHAVSRRRDRRARSRGGRARGDRDLASALLRDDGRVGAHVRLPDLPARGRAEVGDASRSGDPLLGGRDA